MNHRRQREGQLFGVRLSRGGLFSPGVHPRRTRGCAGLSRAASRGWRCGAGAGRGPPSLPEMQRVKSRGKTLPRANSSVFLLPACGPCGRAPPSGLSVFFRPVVCVGERPLQGLPPVSNEGSLLTCTARTLLPVERLIELMLHGKHLETFC